MAYRTSESPVPIVIVSLPKRVVAVEVATGKTLWSIEAASTRVTVAGNLVFVLGWALHCLDYETGRQHWQVSLAHGADTLLVTPEHVIVGGTGEASCYSLTGRLLWTNPFKGAGIGGVGLAVPGMSVQIDRSG